jgi:hypothetical protein
LVLDIYEYHKRVNRTGCWRMSPRGLALCVELEADNEGLHVHI